MQFIYTSLTRFYQRLDRRIIRTVCALAGFFALLAVAFLLFGPKASLNEVSSTTLRTVELISVSEYRSGALGLSAPTADGRAFVVRAESGGRVNRISTAQQVGQGAIIAELDNSAQRAALVQAQGIYEGALAGAARSNISVADAEAGVQSAKEAVVNVVNSSFTAWTNALYNTLDELYDRPLDKFPVVRIDAPGEVPHLSRERGELNEVLASWQGRNTRLSTGQSSADLIAATEAAVRDIDRLSTLIGRFIILLPQQKFEDAFSDADKLRLQMSLSGAQTALAAQKNALQGAGSALTRAEDGLRSARIGGSGGQVSAADAQIKQALGAYQAAQAAFDKTVVRAPFAGTVTSVNVQLGDFINPGSDIAIIVPYEGVATEVFFHLPLSAVKFTPEAAYVFTIDADDRVVAKSVETGLVTAASITVTGLSGEESIIMDVRGLKDGDQIKIR